MKLTSLGLRTHGQPAAQRVIPFDHRAAVTKTNGFRHPRNTLLLDPILQINVAEQRAAPIARSPHRASHAAQPKE